MHEYQGTGILMIIILKKIAPTTTDHHIETFMSPMLKGGLFQAAGHIENISYWKYEIIDMNAIEYYALVDIEPDSVGSRIIKYLNHKMLNGKYIELQEYHHRHWSNDRRIFNSVIYRGKKNKRKTERRRKIMKTEIKRRLEERQENITISTHSGIWLEPSDNKKNKF